MPKRKRRRYNLGLIKETWPYTVQEIAALFGIHKNAVTQWMKKGLEVDTCRRPFLIRGSALIHFLSNRQQRKGRRCNFMEFFCFKCRGPRHVYEDAVDVVIFTPNRLRMNGLCIECDGRVNKLQAVKNLPEIQQRFNVLTLVEERLLERDDPNVNRDKRA